ncbi:MAG: hypothetical protein H2172_16240 [Opitutus sp.]|nr:hypothetical protein [Opitutus sp.]MCS6244649.1 hypothetical protein [Opitutus sp.]MCS6245382.1 hypothetical protein [Opitutus sp.]MCS6248187.1 hypothetical protein [Opitutus sp.]MCS6274521.1 hypothetical protein [Opitutus sp.]
MPTLTTQPLPAAVRRLESKTPVASPLRSAEWAQLQLGHRDRAFFSAGVEQARTIALLQDGIRQALDQSGTTTMDRSKFVATIRQALGAPEGDSGELTDLVSRRRLETIYDFQTEDALEYARWDAGNAPAILDAFPAQELVRIEDREDPRDWAERWAEAGGEFFGGRMVALKDDPLWTKISRFGRPWPPFDFGSGMGLEDIARDEAEAMGLLGPDDLVRPPDLDFNHALEASIPKATPAVMEGFKQLFGDQVDVGRDGKVVWQGQRIVKLYEAALADPGVKWSIDLGTTTAAARAQAAAAGVELRPEAVLNLDADHLRHAQARHGAGEAQGDQRPLTLIDYQLIPHVWREPDVVRTGNQPGDLIFEKKLAGRLAMVTWKPAPITGNMRLHTLYVKKEGGTP